MNKYLLIMFIATFFSASSQILLKQSANQTHKNIIFEYLNWRVILSGVILHESFTKWKLIGNMIIILGVIVYTL